MKGNVIKNLVVAKKAKRMIGKKLIVCGGLSFLLPIEIINAPHVNADASKNIKEETNHLTQEVQNLMMEINDALTDFEKNEYLMYLSYLATLYQVDEIMLQKQIEENLETLFEQENLEHALQTFIEQKIEDGTLIQNIETEEKQVRLTTYQYTPNDSEKKLGGSIGLVEPYIKDGSIYFDENGFAMWKGGTVSKLNGKVYGKAGTDYLIVATATNYLVGQYTYEYNDRINYYQYNDTFHLIVTTKNGEKEYQAIVLDSCGACMDWSTTSSGVYSPKTEEEKGYCEFTNETKIDIFTAPINDPKLTKANDTGYQL